MRTIGERIRARREELGLTQDELAAKLGYAHRTSVAKIEADTRNLTQSKIKAIADALETTPTYIMGWEEEEQEEDPGSGDPELDELRRRFAENLQKMDKTQLAMFVQLMDQVLKNK